MGLRHLRCLGHAVATGMLSMGPSYVSDIRRSYELEIIQQPQRARACGFGDKVSGILHFPTP